MWKHEEIVIMLMYTYKIYIYIYIGVTSLLCCVLIFYWKLSCQHVRIVLYLFPMSVIVMIIYGLKMHWFGQVCIICWFGDMKGRFGIIFVVSILFSKIDKRKKIDTKAYLASCFQNCFWKVFLKHTWNTFKLLSKF